MGLCEDVRRHCAAVAERARWVRIVPGADVRAGGVAGLDPAIHLLDAPAEDVARFVLIMDAVNFGSGWFDTLALPPGEAATNAITRRLTDHARERGGPWSAAELRALDATAVAGVLGQDAAHPLVGLYAEGLNQLGAWLGDRSALEVVAAAGGSAERLAEQLATMPFLADRGFYKRAQITANDLVLAGVADFGDIDRLTIFADNLVPHVLRLDGVLEYHPELAARVDAGEPLEAGGEQEVEIRACAVHACERLAERLGVAPRRLDNWLWNRGLEPPYSERRPHKALTVFY